MAPTSRAASESATRAVLAATTDAAAMQRLLDGEVINGWLWFDGDCAKQFGGPGRIEPARRAAFARCLVGLQLRESARKSAENVVMREYGPGFEVQARVDDGPAGPRLR